VKLAVRIASAIANTNTNTFVAILSLFMSSGNIHFFHGHLLINQLLIAITSLLILCNHIRSKTRLIAIMNLIVTLPIIYTSIHNGGLSKVSVVTASTQCLLLHTNRERGKVGSSELVAAECCVGRCRSCHYLLDRVHSLLHTGLQIPASNYLTPGSFRVKSTNIVQVPQMTTSDFCNIHSRGSQLVSHTTN